MSIRITGMESGLDTESIITELVKANSTKIDKLTKEQTRLQWKQTAWQDLNSKIYSLFSGTLSKLRFSDAYKQKATTVSDTSKASIVASSTAVDGTQTLTVDRMATSGYLTGARLSEDGSFTTSSKLSDINADLVGKTITVDDTEVTITEDMTVSAFTKALAKAGINASFDATNQRFFLSAKATGEDADFTLGGDSDALAALGLNWEDNLDEEGNVIDKTGAVRILGQDAKITLNGAEFTSDTNTFSINGLTITAKAVTGEDEVLTINTETDYDGIYDTIKDFFTKYNEVVNEMSKLYNADSNSDMDPLTDEEKSAMTESQIDEWEEKIKSGLLSGDSTISTVRNAMAEVMMSPITIDGKKVYLSDFGISTADYFTADENERYAYHIDGDSDDTISGTNADKLKSAIAADPESVASFFQQLCNNLYTKLNTLMASTTYSSIYKVYDDKQMKADIEDYDDLIEAAQEKLTAQEDKWYSKFSAMETALSKINSQSSYLTSLFS